MIYHSLYQKLDGYFVRRFFLRRMKLSHNTVQYDLELQIINTVPYDLDLQIDITVQYDLDLQMNNTVQYDLDLE